MASPREREAAAYLKKHKIVELMNNTTSSLFFHRPEDPKAYLIGYLGQLKESKDARVEGPCLFNDSNLDSVFGVLDPANEGYITSAQYMEALATLGVSSTQRCPEGDQGRIPRHTMKQEARKGLQRSSATFEDS